MHLLPIDDDTTSIGVFGVLYGETGVGKTATAIESLPKPILIMANEARNVNLQARAVGVPQKNADGSLNYIIAAYDTFLNLIDFIGDIKTNITKKTAGIDYADIKSVLVDGVSALTNNLKAYVAEVAAEKRDKSKRNFIADSKVAEEGYGTIGDQMLRITSSLSKLSELDNKIVVMTALVKTVENTWNQTQEAMPLFVGRMYGDNLPGMCDFIGLVERRFVNVMKDGQKTGEQKTEFPPMVKFETAPGENFLCKWAGIRPVNKSTGEPVNRIAAPLDLGWIISKMTGTKQDK